ncbi:hypothetical protein NP233_g9943 [Leucocoprinus birnbaumii]|uniref:Uncharacterized protein n=1 Tax=Leucocoprinus birnbaumii TaxID=56174 RepID=A0AAD5VQ30_9AGAR|nr:hypothetical protein NP233_g9943 [Leucocoprinus birnbaumii]
MAIAILSSALACWCCILVELIWSVGDQRAYIWRKPVTPIKAIFVTLKYFPVASQSTSIGLLCLIITLAQTGIAVFVAVDFPKNATFDPDCTASPTPVMFILVIAILIVHGIIWSLTWYKRRKLIKQRAARTRNDLLSIVYRDGAIAFVFTILIAIFFMSYTSFIHIDVHGYMWSQAVISIIGCRIIVNILRLNDDSILHGGIVSTNVVTMPSIQSQAEVDAVRATEATGPTVTEAPKEVAVD